MANKKHYPTTKKRIKATTWGKTLSKPTMKSFVKLGKVGNKARKRKKRKKTNKGMTGAKATSYTSINKMMKDMGRLRKKR